MTAGKFEISKDKAGKFRWHPKAANGEIIAASQAMRRRPTPRRVLRRSRKPLPMRQLST
jgi:uncharacterized protein